MGLSNLGLLGWPRSVVWPQWLNLTFMILRTSPSSLFPLPCFRWVVRLVGGVEESLAHLRFYSGAHTLVMFRSFQVFFSPLGWVDGSFCWKTKRRSQFQRTAVSDNCNTLGFYLARLTLAIATFNSSRERDTETRALSRSRTSSSTTLAQQQQVRPQYRRSWRL